MKEKHFLENTLVNLKTVKKAIEDSEVNGVNVYSHLPSWIWEDFGEVIGDIEEIIMLHKKAN